MPLIDSVYDKDWRMLAFGASVKTDRGRTGKLIGSDRQRDLVLVKWDDLAAIHDAQSVYPEAVNVRWKR